jgi:hypothetical protein
MWNTWKLLLATVISVTCVAAVGQDATEVRGQASPPGEVCKQMPPLHIDDPAEYDAFIKAAQLVDPIEKLEALKEFLSRYPNTVVKAEVLELELQSYQMVKNEDEAVHTTERLLTIEPENLRFLAFLAYTYRECATRKGAIAKKCARDAVTFGERGLSALEKVQCPPTGMTAEEYDNLRTQVRPIFQDAVRVGEPLVRSNEAQSH